MLWNRSPRLGDDKQTALSHRTSNRVWLLLQIVLLFNQHGLQFFAEPRTAFGALQCGVWVAMLWAQGWAWDIAVPLEKVLSRGRGARIHEPAVDDLWFLFNLLSVFLPGISVR